MKSFPHGTPFAVAGDCSFVVHPQHRNDIRITELSTGRAKWERTGEEGVVFSLALTQDNKLLASSAGYSGSAIRLWDVDSGKEMGRLEGHHSYICDLLFFHDGRKLVSASGDQTIRIWDVSNPSEGKLIRTLTGHTTEVLRIALLPDNKTLLSGDRYGTVLVWSLDASERASSRTIDNIASFGFLREDRGVLTLDRNGQVHRYQGENFDERHELFEVGDGFNCYWTCMSPETGLLAVNSNGKLTVWNLMNGTSIYSFGDDPETEPITFLENGRKLLTVNRERDIHVIWDLSAKEPTKSQSWFGASELDWCCRPIFIPDKNSILTTSSFDHAHRLKDVVTQHESHPDVEMYPTSDIALSPDGMSAATSSFEGLVQLWDTTKHIEEIATLGGFQLGAMSVTFSPNGRRLAVGGTGETQAVKIVDVQSRQELITLPGKDPIHYRVAFSPDGNTIGSLSHAGILHLWRAPSWEEIDRIERIRSHSEKQR
jgi:WD40 repeat protein